MSYFFAFEVPDRARAQIAAFTERWRHQVDPALNAKWVVPEDYHITLKYLGDIPPETVDVAVKHAASRVKQQMIHRAEKKEENDKAMIEQKSIVVFPAGKPPVLWIEIIPTDMLRTLARCLLLLPDLTWEQREHRPYKPHITLAYCKPETESGPLTIMEQAFDPFTVNRFVLMRTLPPEQRANEAKARYNTVHTFPLAGTQVLNVP